MTRPSVAIARGTSSGLNAALVTGALAALAPSQHNIEAMGQQELILELTGQLRAKMSVQSENKPEVTPALAPQGQRVGLVHAVPSTNLHLIPHQAVPIVTSNAQNVNAEQKPVQQTSIVAVPLVMMGANGQQQHVMTGQNPTQLPSDRVLVAPFQMVSNGGVQVPKMMTPAITEAYIAGVESVSPSEQVTAEHLVRMLLRMGGPSIDLIVSSKEELKALAIQLTAMGYTDRNISPEMVENTLRLRQQATQKTTSEAGVAPAARIAPRQSAVQESIASRLVSSLLSRSDRSTRDSDYEGSSEVSESSSSD
eukprot:Blabericola_migrator_1__6713@NODE_3397_length_1808_cov_71_869615_g346_i1_p1_GENE_NODE_3397_length_1808_cov_71_869615_g346_i1NODE_3397_length_1808_cov_71_869615_g346_i1_p1_ORF_typecomplete_len309_score55_68HTH_13/PF11972_8/1_6HTH_13/PF11972_8/87_NODE_3397_length_1808_cov_71_869615_g346_i17331659